jgi:hypothetical protein
VEAKPAPALAPTKAVAAPPAAPPAKPAVVAEAKPAPAPAKPAAEAQKPASKFVWPWKRAKPAAPAAAKPLPLEYMESFAADPKWATDQPDNFHWVKERTLFYARCESGAPGKTPNRYAYRLVSYDGKSFALELTLKMIQLDASAGVAFGLFDKDLACGKPNSICLDISRSDKGTTFTLAVATGRINERADFWTNVEMGKAYACRIVYDYEKSTAALEVWDTQSDRKVADAFVKNVKGLPQNMCFLGFCPHAAAQAGAPKGAVAVAELPRVELRCAKGNAVVKPVLPGASSTPKKKIVPQPALRKKAAPNSETVPGEEKKDAK